jgi:hypothetical protein
MEVIGERFHDPQAAEANKEGHSELSGFKFNTEQGDSERGKVIGR